MFPAIFCISIGLLLGDFLHHWYFNWSYSWDTWTLLFLNFIVLAIAWINAADDDLMCFDRRNTKISRTR